MSRPAFLLEATQFCHCSASFVWAPVPCVVCKDVVSARTSFRWRVKWECPAMVLACTDVTKYLRLSGYVRSDSDVMRKYKGLHPAAKEQGKARTLVAQKKLAQISKKATQPVIESTDIAALWNINTTASNASSTARESNTNIAGSTSLPTCVPTPATTDNASENDAIGDPSTAVQKRRSTRPGAGRSGEGSSRRRKKRPRTAVATTVAGDSTSGCAPMGTRVHDSAIVPAEMDLPVPTDARIPTPAEQQEALRIFNNTAVTPNPAITTAATSTQM
eukprot:m.1003228 g.1003228  ORF g.1003228 m.1003228 type:complete len:275 (+) comp24042_c0_seq4:2309-3133(+)